MSTVGQGPALSLGFRSQFQRPSGVELLLNGTFNGSTGWTATAQVTFVSNTAVIVAGGVSNSFVEATGTLSVGRTFRVRMRVSSLTAGTVRVYAGSGTAGTIRSTAGDYTEDLVCAGDTKLYVLYSAACQATISFLSVQEVIQVTLDDASYTSQHTYLGSDAGGATECAGLYKLDVIDRHTGVRTTLADFSANPGVSASCVLPSGWSYSCTTSGRTTQVNSGSIVTSLVSNLAPWKSTNSLSGSLNVEKSTTNAIVRSNEFNLGLWVKAATMGLTPGDDVGPDNVPSSATRITPTVIGDFLTTYFSGVAGQVWMFSYWVKQHSLNQLRVIAYSATLGTNISVVDVTSRMVVGEWRRIDVMFGIPAGGTGTIYVYPHVQGIAPSGGYAWIYGAQAELGAGLTSYVPTAAAAVARASAMLSVPHDLVAFDNGRVPEMVWIPSFAYNEATYDWIIMDDSRGRLYYEQSTQKFVFTVYGRGTIKSLACTFSREQAITIRADVDGATQLATLVVSGCTTGNGTFQTYVQAQRARTEGDGYTAASFGTQLFPRGNQFAGGANRSRITIDGLPSSKSMTAFVCLSAMAKGTFFLLGQQIGAGSGWLLNAEPSAGLYVPIFYVAGTAIYVAGSGVDIADGNFHTLAGTYDDSTGVAAVYADGRLLNSAVRAGVLNLGRLPAYLASPLASWSAVATKVYLATVHTNALTLTQIKELHDRCKWEANT